jgi:hypothetical protein
VGVFGILMLIGFAVVPHAWRFFTSVVPYLTGPEQGKADYNGSLTGVVEYLGLSGSIPAGVTQAVALLVFVGIALRYRRVLAESLYGSVALLVVATLLVPRYSFEVYGLYLVLAFPFILQARGHLEIALASIAVWFLAIRDVLPLHGDFVNHFRQLRPGLGHIALAVLVAVMLERRRSCSATGISRASCGSGRADRTAKTVWSLELRRPETSQAQHVVEVAGRFGAVAAVIFCDNSRTKPHFKPFWPIASGINHSTSGGPPDLVDSDLRN